MVGASRGGKTGEFGEAACSVWTTSPPARGEGDDDVSSYRSVSPHDHTITSLSSRAPTTTVRMSMLLNPSDGDDEPEPDQTESDTASKDAVVAKATKTTTTDVAVVAKVPKKRGRKPILPKMTNSERGKYYRAKRSVYSSDLHQQVEALRSTITRLMAVRAISNELAVCPRNMLSGSLVKLVREYFTQFRYGMQLPPARRNMALPDPETSTTSQEAFMRATMDPELGFGEFKGIGVLMDQWERYSKYHAFLQFELVEVHVRENEDGHILETSALLHSRYSRRTIENVFPHVVGNEALIQRLIGKEVVYPCRNQFYFTADGRIQRYDVEVDFPEALQRAIGSLEDVAVLLGQALIRQQHMVGELEGEELAVIEEIERRVDSTDGGGVTPHRPESNLSGYTSSCSSISNDSDHHAAGAPSRSMDVDFLLSDSNESMDMND